MSFTERQENHNFLTRGMTRTITFRSWTFALLLFVEAANAVAYPQDSSGALGIGPHPPFQRRHVSDAPHAEAAHAVKGVRRFSTACIRHSIFLDAEVSAFFLLSLALRS